MLSINKVSVADSTQLSS